jgi:hypothetical protein
MYLRIRNSNVTVPKPLEIAIVFWLFFAGLFGAGYVWAVYEWAGVSAILSLVVFGMYIKIDQTQSRANTLQQFIWASELRYDLYPSQPRPSEEQLLRFRRARIESDPELSAREWHE